MTIKIDPRHGHFYKILAHSNFSAVNSTCIISFLFLKTVTDNFDIQFYYKVDVELLVYSSKVIISGIERLQHI